jgi:large subunit ribosomal protein L7A
MVKGVSKTIIEVNNTGSKYFEKIVFYVTPQYGNLSAKQLKKALLCGRAKQVFLAENADPAITDPIAELCRQHSIMPIWVSSMTDLGQACGIEVGAAAAAVVN